ncbi:MAG: nucleotidyltransferase family protein [Dehalococcoidia bacterium]|nr:nucleotidyltransferase family protein [Dehalococcoidia bacterium]
MTELERIITTLRENMPFLTERYGVKTLQVFGSYVRGEQKRKSDVDILVEFSDTIDLLDFINLERRLSELLGVKVDLVMKEALKPRLKDRILDEALPV